MTTGRANEPLSRLYILLESEGSHNCLYSPILIKLSKLTCTIIFSMIIKIEGEIMRSSVIIIEALILTALLTGNLYFFIFLLIGVGIFYCYSNHNYKKSTYHISTKRSLLSLLINKGSYGEYLTYKALSAYENDDAKFLFNLYIPKDNGETSEIDVLMISHKGLFVYESKNYSGWIYGKESQRTWTQTLAHGHTKNHFYNPILQNESHIKYLNTFLSSNYPTHSIVVFSERCTLKNIEISNPSHHVIQRHQVKSMTDFIYSDIPYVLTDADIQLIYARLYELTQVSDAVKARHIDQIKSHYVPMENTSPHAYDTNSYETNRPDLICPRCGNKLVLRTARKGKNAGKQFWGCSNYPKCHFIKDVL